MLKETADNLGWTQESYNFRYKAFTINLSKLFHQHFLYIFFKLDLVYRTLTQYWSYSAKNIVYFVWETGNPVTWLIVIWMNNGVHVNRLCLLTTLQGSLLPCRLWWHERQVGGAVALYYTGNHTGWIPGFFVCSSWGFCIFAGLIYMRCILTSLYRWMRTGSESSTHCTNYLVSKASPHRKTCMHRHYSETFNNIKYSICLNLELNTFVT